MVGKCAGMAWGGDRRNVMTELAGDVSESRIEGVIAFGATAWLRV
jgi:hypothetical protein